MKLNKKYFWNILLIVTVTAVAMYFSLKDNFTQIVQALAGMNTLFLLVILCWGLLFTSVWGWSYKVLCRRFRKDYSLLQGIVLAFVGTFFAGITPSSTGGQFGQIYILKKQGIKFSDGASLLWADFIIYQTALMIYVTILFALRFAHYAGLSAWFWVVFTGYVVNLVVVAGLYTMALFPKVYVRISEGLARFLAKIRLVKDVNSTVEHWTGQVSHFTHEIKALSRDRDIILKSFLINFLRLSLYFSLPYVISWGVGIKLPINDLVDVLALSSFVTMANSFIPLPGASGGTEVVFTLMFTSLLGDLTGAVLLLWRISTYYVPMIAGAVIFVVFKYRYDRKGEAASSSSIGDNSKIQ